METLRSGDRGHFVYRYGYFLPWKNELVPTLEAEGVDVACFEARNNVTIMLAAHKVAMYLRRWKADLLHCHLPIAGAVGRLAGRLAGVPVVYTEHNEMSRYHPLTRYLNIATWRWQNRVIAVSGRVAESVRCHAGQRVPLDVVRNGVDAERYDRRGVDDSGTLRRALGIPVRAPVVGTVAVFREQKKLQNWLRAARLIRRQRPETHFLLVGDGPLRSKLEAYAVDLGLSDAVSWPGLQEDVRPYLAAMNVYMMSSEVEGLPIALLEAMSMRCTVVSTEVGGIPEAIRDGRNGYLVEPGRPELLAQVTSRLLASPSALERTGEEARRTVEREFTIERMSQRLEATYVDVVSQHRNDG